MPQTPGSNCHQDYSPMHPTPYFDAYCSALATPENPKGKSEYWCWWQVDDRIVLPEIRCPFGKPGDRLWVREAWVGAKIGGYDGREDGGQFWYRATDDGILDHETKWRPSIHMPRRASRITLEITDVRAQRLQDITEDDAIAEGATSKPNSWGFNLEYDGWNMNWPTAEPAEGWSYLSLMTPQLAFGNYINVLHGGENWNLKPTNLWDENPFVWALTFRVLEVRS